MTTGLADALGYELPTPNALQRAVWHVTSSRPGAWVFARISHHIDRFVLRLTHGRATAATVLAGIPVITLVTTGARSGRRRQTPLLGVPIGGDLAVIGTRFGQAGTPGWYHNLRADPAAEVRFRGRSCPAAAREAQGEEWQAIWDRARSIYGGYEAYARRINDRAVHIMVLSPRAEVA